MSSTDIKDYYRRAWGLKDRPGFKYGGSWADWQTNYSDQMTFEEYLQDDNLVKKPHFLDRKAEGGKVRKRHAIGLAVPIYTGLVALTGMTMNAAKNYLDKNPEIYNKLASNFDGNMEKLKENISRYIPGIHGPKDKNLEDLEKIKVETFPKQENWADSFGTGEGTKIPEPEKQKPPVSGDIILPPQLGGSEIPETKKEDIIFTSQTAEGMLEEDDHSQDEDVLEVKATFDKVMDLYKAGGEGVSKKINDLNSEEFALKVKEIIDTKYGGTIRNLADDIGIERVRINTLFKKHGIKTDRSGNITQQTVFDLWQPEDKQFLKDFTTNAKYDKNFINNRVEKNLGKDFNKDQFVNWKDLSEIMGIKHRTKKDELKTDSTDLQARLNRLGVKKKKGKGKEVLWHLGDAILKIQKKALTKPVVGTGTYHNTKRREFEANTDPEGYKAENKVKQNTREIIKEVLGENYVPFALEESGHAISINNQLSFEELFKNSNASWISSKIMQDPVLNKEILAARNSIEKGIENSERKQLLILEELLGKEANAENFKAALEAVEIMNQRRKNIKTDPRIKKNKFLTDQANRIPLYELTLPRQGETFKSGFLNIDMSSIEPSVSVGKILEINPNAKSFNDLSKKEQALYKENLKNQYIDFATYYYKKRGLDKDDIEDLFDALTEGKEKKAEGGLSGVDQYILNRYK
tara:strand:- start:59 stop:2134 length:2076 start_codon:yes stop_codon:yes gene_type:complete